MSRINLGLHASLLLFSMLSLLHWSISNRVPTRIAPSLLAEIMGGNPIPPGNCDVEFSDNRCKPAGLDCNFLDDCPIEGWATCWKFESRTGLSAKTCGTAQTGSDICVGATEQRCRVTGYCRYGNDQEEECGLQDCVDPPTYLDLPAEVLLAGECPTPG